MRRYGGATLDCDPGLASAAATSALHDRAQELARITGRLAQARAGTGGLTVIEGPAGIGKTSLLAAACSQAEENRMHVLAGRGSELERDYAYGVLRQAFERPLAELDSAEREALTAGQAAHALPMFDPGRAAASSESLLHGLYWLVANLGERRPLVLAVDDAQWSDESSVLALAYLARRINQLPVALVVCTRPPDPESRSALGTLVVEGSAERLLPQPLGEEAVAALSGNADEEFVRAALDVTGGNPFLLDQLLRELGEERSPDAVARAAPDELGRRVLARVSDPARSLAFALSVLGERATLAECARLAELDGDASAAMGELVAAGVLADDPQLRFRHPLIGAAVVAGLSSTRRADWHSRAAALLRESGADAERQAIHLAACPPAGDEHVAQTLAEAAERALARGAPAEAEPLLRRALEEPPALEARPQMLLARGEVLTMAGDPEAAGMFAEAARLSGDPEVRAAALEARGWWWALEPGAVEADIAAIDELLASLPDDATTVRARVESVRLAVASRSAPVMDAALERAERLGLLAEDASPHPDLLATTALWCVPSGAHAVDYALRAVRAADASGPPFPPSLWLPFAFAVLMMGERHEEARGGAPATYRPSSDSSRKSTTRRSYSRGRTSMPSVWPPAGTRQMRFGSPAAR